MTMLDSELYKYVPSIEAVTREFSQYKAKGLDQKLLAQKETDAAHGAGALTEVNPMLGNRGVRWGISYPEVYDMQIQAIFEATAMALREKVDVRPEVMMPQVCTRQELMWVKERAETHPSRGGKALQCQDQI